MYIGQVIALLDVGHGTIAGVHVVLKSNEHLPSSPDQRGGEENGGYAAWVLNYRAIKLVLIVIKHTV